MFWKKDKTPKYEVPQITDATFNELVLESKVPVLLDFYADWCEPCKVMSPIINELSEAFESKALVAKINTERNPKLGQHFKVKSIPTLILINKGELFERFQGVVPKPNLEEILELYIAENKV